MNASYIVGEVLIDLTHEEIGDLEKVSSIDGKIWICHTNEEFPLRLYIRNTPDWLGDVIFQDQNNPSSKIIRYEVGFPHEGLDLLKKSGTVYASFLSAGLVNFRAIRIRRWDVL